MEIIKVLLEAKAKVEARDQDGRTPLHLAILEGHENAVRALIKGGANVQQQIRGIHLYLWR